MLPASCVPPLPEGCQIGARTRGHLVNTILNQPYRCRVSTDRLFAKTDSWLHFSRASPALHPPERPYHIHTPEPGFGGREHEGEYIYIHILYIPYAIISDVRQLLCYYCIYWYNLLTFFCTINYHDGRTVNNCMCSSLVYSDW